ncbi:uncharacterized protein LOC130927676 isoform X2 [Corythoichthys intestinalis]|uniref:uncharacterized protein LOC130927676 isoform X2 n=1 Tax=Corythoichthys intestinalis TaxID=161448 RepID=UPI0025A52146|nr:uncharacterized protein LOC130927676 isoform X2 [Corythoichthys intestinalis]
MRARRTPAEKLEAELCGAKHQRQHQLSNACKMQVKVVLRRLPDLYVSQDHRPEHQESACIKEEEESRPIQAFGKCLCAERQEPESPGVKEDVELTQIKEEEEPEPHLQKQLPIKKEEKEELSYVKDEEGITGAIVSYSSKVLGATSQ